MKYGVEVNRICQFHCEYIVKIFVSVEIIIESMHLFELATEMISVAAEIYGTIEFIIEIVRIFMEICYRLIDQL